MALKSAPAASIGACNSPLVLPPLPWTVSRPKSCGNRVGCCQFVTPPLARALASSSTCLSRRDGVREEAWPPSN